MSRLLLEPVNLLVLDEPTNHLDMRSKDILKKALLAYDGTLIAVSHDREFLDGLVSKVFEFRNKAIREHIGGIYEFLERKKIASMDELERNNNRNSGAASSDSSSKKAFIDKKEYDREVRKLENRVLKIEAEIAGLETQIARFEQKIANPAEDPESLKAPDFYSTYENMQAELRDRLVLWEQIQIDLDQLKNKRN
jgi:ATP-binding cassette subfamily F protein 3